MKKVIGKIYSTTDYDSFKLRADNRPINKDHVLVVAKSIEKIGQRQPVSIDTKNYIIDGQHRVEACRLLKIPFHYVIDRNSTSTNDLTEIQIKREWTVSNRAGSFALSDDNYKFYNEFTKSYKEFSHTLRLSMLCNIPERSKKLEEDFKVGKFQVKNYKKACETAEMLRNFGQYYKGYKSRGFVSAILTMKENKEFDLSRMMRKMPLRGRDLMDFSRTEDYIKVLEEMYNWKESKKVYFTRN